MFATQKLLQSIELGFGLVEMAHFEVVDFFVERQIKYWLNQREEGIVEVVHGCFVCWGLAQQLGLTGLPDQVTGDGKGLRHLEISVGQVGEIGEVADRVDIIFVLFFAFVELLLEVQSEIAGEMSQRLPSPPERPVSQHNFITHQININAHIKYSLEKPSQWESSMNWQGLNMEVSCLTSSIVCFLHHLYPIAQWDNIVISSNHQIQYLKMKEQAIDIYLTPRFWKGEVVYDGRRPLLVYQQQEGRPHLDETKPYPPEYTRKLGPEDGIIYELSQLQNIKSQGQSVGIKMIICVTMYNEPIDFLERTLTGIYKNFIKLVKQKGLSPKEMAVVIIQDGILKLVTDRATRKMSSSVRFFERMDYNSGKSECLLVSRINQILDDIEELQKNGLGPLVSKNGGLPPTVPKNVSLLYQFEWKPTKDLEERYKINEISYTDPNLRVMACFKHLNAKKLSSHLWFFQGFCRLLNPQFCTLMDVGTEPYDTGLINFMEALESDPHIGGVSGFMTLDIDVKSSESQMNQKKEKDSVKTSKKYSIEHLCSPIPVISTIFFLLWFVIKKVLSCCVHVIEKAFIGLHQCFSAQRAQLFQYNFSHMVDKNFESFFKYLNVLPGAWSAYRYEAISRGDRYEQNLLQKNYLKMVLDPNYTEKDFKEANVYLAEDRVLCLGIYCQKDAHFTLQYVPKALAKTDPMDNLIDLLIQRRRWINSSYFAFDYVYKNYDFEVRESAHTFWDRNILFPFLMLFSKLSIIATYFGPAVFFFALFTSTHETYVKFRPPKDYIRSQPWILIPGFICLGYLAAVISLIIISLHKKANEFSKAFVFLSSVLGVYNLILIAIVVTYIVLNYLVPQDVPKSARVTREIIKYLIIINFFCLVLPIFLHLFTHPKRVLQMLDPRTFLSYLYYQAAYTHTFVIYAFSNVDDVTWGTKGVQQDKGSAMKNNMRQEQYYRCKTRFFGKWIVSNSAVCFVLIVINEVFVEQQNKAVILTAIGMLSTVIVAVKCIFGVLHHFRCIFLDMFCLRSLKYDQAQKRKLEDRLNRRTQIALKKPAKPILPSDLFDDLYEEEGRVPMESNRHFFRDENLRQN